MALGRGDSIILVTPVSVLGGAERSLLELAEAVNENIDFVPYFACPKHGELYEAVVEKGIGHVPLPGVGPGEMRGVFGRAVSVLIAAWTIIVLWSHARRLKAKLIHANGIRACLPAAVAARLAGIPCIWHVRDYPHRFWLLHRIAAKLAARVIVPSEFLSGVFNQAKGMKCESLIEIPNGVRCPDMTIAEANSVRQEFGMKSGEILVTMVAQLVPWKRHDLFLDAAALLIRKSKDFRFLLVGSDIWGVHSAYIGQLKVRASESALAGRVVFAGQRSDVGTILAASDVVVLPSDYEPFGRVVVESWWAGTPIVVTNEGGPADIVKDGRTAITFQGGSATDLARAIELLASNKDLRNQLAANGRKAVAQYDIIDYAKAIARIYSELVM